MALTLNQNYLRAFVGENQLEAIRPEIEAAKATLTQKSGRGNDFLGWLDLPIAYDKDEFAKIKRCAKAIQESCDIFVVIGIGGSYLGARAAIEFLYGQSYNALSKKTPAVYFAGNNIDSSALSDLLSICEGKDVCINVVSKSGKTTEPAIAFRVFREYLEKRYGKEGMKNRIYVTTDARKGKLKELADAEGYETFVVPDDVGGRYSVLTAVGLLPIAVSGADIDKMMAGAAAMRETLLSAPYAENPACQYAAIRNLLYRGGKKTEIFVSYESAMVMLAEWWKQLYGESEGKEIKGIFPASVTFSTDLHSLGQYIQQGERTLFETVLIPRESNASIPIPCDPDDIDSLSFLEGKNLHEINMTAFKATALAHNDGGVPNLVLEFDRRDETAFGELVYFFEFACGVSAYTLGVNPFDQPGVEDYKNNMYALLGKPGEEHAARRAELEKRILK
ncbi:MAG: glucose-6-phosphate isomerase [Ruminococcaceae bacterium]|nr:glucose-6-phosphate isomerase [Oscillospiraceae bacterium]